MATNPSEDIGQYEAIRLVEPRWTAARRVSKDDASERVGWYEPNDSFSIGFIGLDNPDSQLL